MAKARALAAARGVAVDHRVDDFAYWPWDAARYDAVVAIFIQFLPPGEREEAFARMQAAVAPGGVLLLQGYRPEQVDYVIMGQVLMAGQGQVPARQAAVKAGIPMRVPSVNVNKVCLSGLNAVYLADQMIAAGEADIVVAGGMESMTKAPYLLPGARAGYRLGDQKVVDSMMYDGLFCAFDQVAMGAGTEKYAASAASSGRRRTSWRRRATSGRPRPRRTTCSMTRSSRSRSRSARAIRSS